MHAGCFIQHVALEDVDCRKSPQDLSALLWFACTFAADALQLCNFFGFDMLGFQSFGRSG